MLDSNLRPQVWNDFVGQDFVKGILQQALKASQERGELLDHILLYGPSGLGKTSLARLVGGEILAEVHGQDTSLLGSILSQGRTGRCIFIDEFHTMGTDFQEMLIRLLNKGLIGTIIAATSRPIGIVAPLRNRFGIALRLDFYTEDALAQIARNSAEALGLTLTEKADMVLAKRSRGIPRMANMLLRRVRDIGTSFSGATMGEALDEIGVDAWGVQRDERRYLLVLALKFGGGPTGLSTLAGSMSEGPETLGDLYEPFLLRCGLIAISSRGRRLTENGMEYLSKTGIEREV